MPTALHEGVFHLALRGVNAYVVDEAAVPAASGDELVLIDAGTPLAGGAVRAGLADLGHRPADVDRVLLTHFDVDHAGGLARLGAAPPVHAHPVDGGVLVRERAPDRSLKGLTQRLLRPAVRPPPGELATVTDGEAVGGFEVVATPGHTPGHLAFVHEAASAAFVGDLVVASDGELAPSPWYLSHDADRVRRSIREFAGRVPPVDVVAMGHGDPVTDDGGDALAALAARA